MRREELGARRSGGRLPIVPPRNAIEAAAAAGEEIEVVLEVADDRVHVDPRVLLGDRARGVAQGRLTHVERHEAPELPGARERVEQRAGSSPTCPSRAR